MQHRSTVRLFPLTAAAAILSGIGSSTCSVETGDPTVAQEQHITQDISAARDRRLAMIPTSERLAQQPPSSEPRVPGGPELPSVPPSPPASVRASPKSGNPPAGHDFALGTCTPCHVVAPDQKSPVRFADAPDFRAIARAPGTTQIGLNIWLTNPHPTMPKLVLDPQEAADVIAYILSLRDQR